MATDREDALAKLRFAHRFPGPFSFKAIGPPGADFVAQATQAITLVVGPMAAVEVSTRESRGGKHAALTLTVACQRAEEVLDVYAALGRVPGVTFLL